MVLSGALAPAALARPQDRPEMGEVLEAYLPRSAPSWTYSADTPLPTVDRSEAAMRAKYPDWDTFAQYEKDALMSAPDPNIQAMLQKMDINDMKSLFYTLENGYSLPNRATKTQNYLKSTDWIKGVVNSRRPSMDVRWHDENRGYRNVIVELKGSDPAAPQYEIGGHLDSVPAGPGMDDDGSGALGSIWIGLAMAGYKFKSTVRFIAFDAEESGLVGSGHYVNDIKGSLPQCTQGGTNCLAFYLNLDMIASDPSNLNRYNVRCNKQTIIDTHAAAKTDYAIQVGQSPSTSTGGGSDHVPYKNNGYDHCMNSEPTFSQNYHKSSDTINGTGGNGLNFDTMYGVLLTSAAVMATYAGMQGPANQSQAVRLDLTPKNPSIDTTQTQQFDAKGYDSNNQPAPLPGSVAWSVDPASGGTIGPQGGVTATFTPAQAGTFTIKAVSGTLNDSTTITVNQGGVVRIEVAPQNSNMKEHEKKLFTAQGCNAQNVCSAITLDSWAVTGGGVKATITQPAGGNPGGEFTPDGAGTYKVTAKKSALEGYSNITVAPLVLQSLTISMSDSACTGGGNDWECDVTQDMLQVGAEAVDDTGTTIKFDPVTQGYLFDGKWTSNPASVTIRADMLMTGHDQTLLGQVVKITVNAFSKTSNELNVKLVPGQLATLVLNPTAAQSVAGGGTVQFTTDAKDSKGNSLTDPVKGAMNRLTFTWSVNPSTMGTVDSNGLFTGVKKGTGKVLLKLTDSKGPKELSDDTTVTVTSDGTAQPAPKVSSTDPASGATKVPLTSKIVITFDRQMDKTVTEKAVSASPSITWTAAWSGGDTVLTLTPSADLKNDQTYDITVSTAAKSSAGVAMAAAYKFSFGTGTAGGGPPPGPTPIGFGDLMLPLIIIIILVVVAVAVAMMMRKKKPQQQQGYWQQQPGYGAYDQGQPPQGPQGGWG
jgi:hypothetical protein